MNDDRCPLSGSWAMRGYNGTCACGRKVRIRSDMRLAEHKKPVRRPVLLEQTNPEER